ncbi:hypothetical protein Salat_1140600 [Sesamum alatum]|uniref:Uncharacterized protein n=1 Tax=Sesamum alatum TaxID=300844 RepID=A0AAE1YDT0_9LAMI|nr:hypothetical protein Salat_1140600 [Sesamum alatum]
MVVAFDCVDLETLSLKVLDDFAEQIGVEWAGLSKRNDAVSEDVSGEEFDDAVSGVVSREEFDSYRDSEDGNRDKTYSVFNPNDKFEPHFVVGFGGGGEGHNKKGRTWRKFAEEYPMEDETGVGAAEQAGCEAVVALAGSGAIAEDGSAVAAAQAGSGPIAEAAAAQAGSGSVAEKLPLEEDIPPGT